VSVGERPSLAVLVTGDELVPVEALPQGGQIRNSNGPALLAQARSCGAVAEPLGVAADRTDALAAAMRPGLEADVLVVSGGVSAGEFDLVEDVFADYGVEVFFDQVAIKPGKPLVFGRRDETLVFGLPGNPVSAMVTFEVFVRPALLALQGARALGRPVVVAELLGPLRNRSKRRAHLPVVVSARGAGLFAEPVPSRGSADVVAHARATGLAVLDAEQRDAATGDRVSVRVLPGFGVDGA
jgi:molybdopterin molybdotransferase